MEIVNLVKGTNKVLDILITFKSYCKSYKIVAINSNTFGFLLNYIEEDITLVHDDMIMQVYGAHLYVYNDLNDFKMLADGTRW